MGGAQRPVVLGTEVGVGGTGKHCASCAMSAAHPAGCVGATQAINPPPPQARRPLRIAGANRKHESLIPQLLQWYGNTWCLDELGHAGAAFSSLAMAHHLLPSHIGSKCLWRMGWHRAATAHHRLDGCEPPKAWVYHQTTRSTCRTHAGMGWYGGSNRGTQAEERQKLEAALCARYDAGQRRKVWLLAWRCVDARVLLSKCLIDHRPKRSSIAWSRNTDNEKQSSAAGRIRLRSQLMLPEEVFFFFNIIIIISLGSGTEKKKNNTHKKKKNRGSEARS